MSLLGKRLVQSAQEAIKIANGDLKLPRYKMIVPSDLDIKSIRQKLKMTQGQFADAFGFPIATLRDWEQGRSRPDTSARAYLTVIEREPKAVERALTVA
jgi:putative transcriptional regulator